MTKNDILEKRKSTATRIGFLVAVFLIICAGLASQCGHVIN